MEAAHIKKRYQRIFKRGAKIDIPEGWFWLLSGLCDALDRNRPLGLRTEPLQIHSVEHRLGTLSIHYSGGEEICGNMICAVQLMSNTVCQQCAGTNEVGGTFGPSIYTLCQECWETDPEFSSHTLSKNVFSEQAIVKIEYGLASMPENWFKKRLIQLISQ